MKPTTLSWIELDSSAIRNNLSLFRKRIGGAKRLLIPVKANAYGHGLAEMSRAFVEAGADWLGVHSLVEAEQVAALELEVPVLILGYVPQAHLKDVARGDFHLTLFSLEVAQAFARAAREVGKMGRVHLKAETGTHRQGVDVRELKILAQYVMDSPYLQLVGVSTHFANVEDTTDHSYARYQLERFEEHRSMLQETGLEPELYHTASSAPTMLFQETHFDMVRVGISAYGLWPSKETYVSLLQEGQQTMPLQPVLSWKTFVHQVKTVPSGAYIGYGCTYKTTHTTRLAILPIGYSDGVDRRLSNQGYVLIKGQRAPIRGRVCMNLVMVEITDIEGVELEEEVVLIGRQGEEVIEAGGVASMIGTIHYELVARINPFLERRLV